MSGYQGNNWQFFKTRCGQRVSCGCVLLVVIWLGAIFACSAAGTILANIGIHANSFQGRIIAADLPDYCTISDQGHSSNRKLYTDSEAVFAQCQQYQGSKVVITLDLFERKILSIEPIQPDS